MPRSHMEIKLAHIMNKFPDLEVVWFVDDDLAKSNQKFSLISVDIEEYWVDKNIAGEDEILIYMINDKTFEPTLNTVDECEYECACKIELMQDSGEITRNIIVRLGVE